MMSSLPILDATVLTNLQSCQRQALLFADWQPIKWRPKSLFDHCLRNAIVTLSSGIDAATVAIEARAEFMEKAANPGLDILGKMKPGYGPYTIAKDYCAMLDTILRSLSRLTLLKLSPVPMTVDWCFLSRQDDLGQLHRWITVDHWDEDELTRQLHSWYTIGDVVFAEAPMMIHAIEIGRQQNGRRSSPWARIFKNPDLPNLKLRFRGKTQWSDGVRSSTGKHETRKKSGELKGWIPVYLADMLNFSPDAWVEQLWNEGLAQELVHHITVNVPSEPVCQDTRIQIRTEAERLHRLLEGHTAETWATLPMSRAACDPPGRPCPFQPACYSEQIVQLENLGLFSRRNRSSQNMKERVLV
jgi:hypothetical protein